MSVSPFDSALHGGLFADPELATLFSDAAELRALLEVEAALARVEGRLGIIPAEAAEKISAAAARFAPEPGALAAGTANAGIPIPALVAALRAAVGDDEAAGFVHWGATSQDIIDSGLVLRLREAIVLLEARLERLAQGLAALAETHRTTVMVGRTRGQQAVPTSFGLKAATWLAPLLRAQTRLAELKPRLLLLSFGGAAGNLSAFGDRGLELAEALAADLQLGLPAAPWHVQRDGIAEFGSWLTLVTGSLGKLGQDVLLLAQNEVGELREGGKDRGGSITMPQKANPVSSEVLVTLAQMNAGLLANLQRAMLQEQERGGPGWQLEWLTLPQMVVATGAALRHAEELTAGLEVDAARMRANLEASQGLVLAEAASFALAATMPRPAAQALVKAACAEVPSSGRHLFDILAETAEAPVDWLALRDPAAQLGSAEAFIDRVLAEHARG